MEHYVDAEKLKAEIERRESKIKSQIAELGNFESNEIGLFNYLDLYDDILSIITSLQQEQSEVDLENYISDKLRELGADLIDPFNRGLNAGMANAYNDILDRLNARKEESVEVAESPSKTFKRVNEFDGGSSYRR